MKQFSKRFWFVISMLFFTGWLAINAFASQMEENNNNVLFVYEQENSSVSSNRFSQVSFATISKPFYPTLTGSLSESPAYILDSTDVKEIPIYRLPAVNLMNGKGQIPFPDELLADLGQDNFEADSGFITPKLSFLGQSFTNVNPPDPVGDVGIDHYVQLVNGNNGSIINIYDKSGNKLLGPVAIDSLGSDACSNGKGDPIVLYDLLADRWLISEISNSGNYLCIYVSITGDPTISQWYSYTVETPNFPDYPKYSLWPNAYFITTNEVEDIVVTPAIYAFDRRKMLNGEPIVYQRFSAPALPGYGFQVLTPADLDGWTLPPVNSPGYFMRHVDDEAHMMNPEQSADFLEVWALNVDFNSFENSIFYLKDVITITEYDSDLCGYVNYSCFPMPETTQKLDPLREMVMWRLQYRKFLDYESMVGNMVTDVDGSDHGGIRWFEVRNYGDGWDLYQEGTYAPDEHIRWVGSIAMDGKGNLALGYNVVGSKMYPSLKYTGRLATDPLGLMSQGETTLGEGLNYNSSYRYGDYNAMVVDPVDDCTFWLTGGFNPGLNWGTQIGAFSFDACSQDAFADLELTKIANTSSIKTGDLITFTLVVTNTGPNWVPEILVRDPITVGLTYIKAPPHCNLVGEVIECIEKNVPPKAVIPIAIVMKGGNQVEVITNKAEVIANYPDPNMENNQAEVTINIQRFFYSWQPLIIR